MVEMGNAYNILDGKPERIFINVGKVIC